MIKVSSTWAARNLSDLINRVRYRSEEFLIERGGEPVCRLLPAVSVCTGDKLKTFFAQLPKPDKEYWDAIEEATTLQPALPAKPWSS